MSNNEEKRSNGRRLLAGGLIMAGALSMTACETGADSTTGNSKNACAVPLGGDINSIDRVRADLTKLDSGFQGDAILLDGDTGKVKNLNVNNPTTSQQPGDIVWAKDVSLKACDSEQGTYYVHTTEPQLPAAPPTSVVE